MCNSQNQSQPNPGPRPSGTPWNVVFLALYTKMELLFGSQHNLENNVMGHPVDVFQMSEALKWYLVKT